MKCSESQIVKALKEVEGGRNVKELCREYEISEATYYNWCSKYGGVEPLMLKSTKGLRQRARNSSRCKPGSVRTTKR